MRQNTFMPVPIIISGMATRIRKGARLHYYIKEHMERLGVSDAALAGRLDVSVETVWKRYKQQHRLTPDKVAEMAFHLDMEVTELMRPPGVPSLDAITKGADSKELELYADMIRRMRAG